MSTPIDPSKWVWFGYPQHFIGAAKCRFHLATLIGNRLVSTVGDCRNTDKDEPGAIGSGPDEFFETYVFKSSPSDRRDSCGCCAAITSYSELDGRRCKTAVEATAMHSEFCARAAAGEFGDDP